MRPGLEHADRKILVRIAAKPISPHTDNVELLLADYANNSYHVNDFYLTEDKIGIALEVNFASGGYVQYEAEYQLLKSCQKESDIWTFIQK